MIVVEGVDEQQMLLLNLICLIARFGFGGKKNFYCNIEDVFLRAKFLQFLTTLLKVQCEAFSDI